MKLLFLSLFFCTAASALSQTQIQFNIEQADMLQIKLTDEIGYFPGAEIHLGEYVSVIGGTEPYSYYWETKDSIISALLNPVVQPMAATTYSIYVRDNNGCTSQDSVKLSHNPTHSVQNSKNLINVYPNPTSSIFFVEYTKSDYLISLFNESGALLWKNNGSNQMTFKSPNSPGIYFIKIDENKESYVRKLMVK